MRLRVSCESCGPVVVQPQAVTVLRSDGSPAEGLFECPVCCYVRGLRVDKHRLTLLVARGANEVRDASDPRAPIGLADLQRLQALLEDDDASLQTLTGGAL
jgi:hypothetical protein